MLLLNCWPRDKVIRRLGGVECVSQQVIEPSLAAVKHRGIAPIIAEREGINTAIKALTLACN